MGEVCATNVARSAGTTTVDVNGRNVTITTKDWTAQTRLEFNADKLEWSSQGSGFGVLSTTPVNHPGLKPSLLDRQLANRIQLCGKQIGGTTAGLLAEVARHLRNGSLK